MEPKTLKVFISATSSDLRTIRNLIKDALLNLGCFPVVQDHFPPDHREVKEMLRERIKDCDVLIHIAGGRYGAEPDPTSLPANAERKSYTQLELELARELKLQKVFTFVCSEHFPYDAIDEAGDTLKEEPPELKTLQQNHRKRLLSQKELYYEVSSPDAIALQVREIQFELEEIRKQAQLRARQITIVGSGIFLILLLILGVILGVQKNTKNLQNIQGELAEKQDVWMNTDRVLSGYQLRFQELRESSSSGRELTIAETDSLVRTLLTKELNLSPELVTTILDVEAPRLARLSETPIDRRLSALFAIGEFVSALEIGKKELAETGIQGFRTMGSAALAAYERSPSQNLHREAVRYYRASLELTDKIAEPDSWADGALLLVWALLESGSYPDAEPLARSALQIMSDAHGETSNEAVRAMARLADALAAQNRFGEAEPLYRIVLAHRIENLGVRHEDSVVAMNDLGLLLRHRNNYEEAERLYIEALDIREDILGSDHLDTIDSMNNLASVYRLQKKFGKSEAIYNDALKRLRRTVPDHHPDQLMVKNNLALSRMAQNDFSTATEFFREVLDGAQLTLGERHPNTLITKNNLGSAVLRSGNFEEGIRILKETAEEIDEVEPINYLLSGRSYQYIAEGYFSINDWNSAVASVTEACRRFDIYETKSYSQTRFRDAVLQLYRKEMEKHQLSPEIIDERISILDRHGIEN